MYIQSERRQSLDPFIQHLSQRISSRADLVYALVMLAATEVRSQSYPELGSVYGDMMVAAQEFHRRVIVPVLDAEAIQNGDMFKVEPPSRPPLKSV